MTVLAQLERMLILSVTSERVRDSSIETSDINCTKSAIEIFSDLNWNLPSDCFTISSSKVFLIYRVEPMLVLNLSIINLSSSICIVCSFSKQKS